jgi:8-oxo-dGTP pyrophosphatase MutT (NUDIX family)
LNAPRPESIGSRPVDLGTDKTYGKRVSWDRFRVRDRAGGNFTEVDWLIFSAEQATAVSFPVTVAGDVVALEQFGYGARGVLWELPGGGAEEPEPAGAEQQTAESAAAVQFREETGYACQQMSRLGDADLWLDPASCSIAYVPFLATGCHKEGEPHRGIDEFFEPREVPLEEWFRMIFRGDVTDSKTIAMSMLALGHLSDDLKRRARTAVMNVLAS